MILPTDAAMAAPWLVAAVLLFLAAIHPFVTYPLSLVLWRKLRARPAAAALGHRPLQRMALCVCAYNEERVITAKIENALSLRERQPDLEILLYVDAASDSTAAIAQRYADRITLLIGSERHGKTFGMNRLVERAQADIVVFSDANVMLAADALDRLLPYFSDPRVGCVCGHLRYVNPDASVTAGTGSLYWRLEEWIKQQETALGSMMGADGSLFAIRRVLHRPPPDDIIDDMYVSFQILCAGYRVVQAQDVCAQEESVTVASEEFRRKVRIACQAFNVHRLIWPQMKQQRPRLLYMYLSHKVLRWFSIYSLAGAGLCFLIALCLLGWSWVAMALTALAAAAVTAGLRFSVPLLSQAADVLTALLGAGIGIWRSVRGDRYQVWQPAQSIRK